MYYVYYTYYILNASLKVALFLISISLLRSKYSEELFV